MFWVWGVGGRTYGFAVQTRADIENHNEHGTCGVECVWRYIP